MISPDAIALVAERKIAEAMEQGLFDDLPGYGKPLPEDEFAVLPDEVRLCARILKSASYLEGPDVPLAAAGVQDLLDPGPGGAREAYRGMERLALSLKDPRLGRRARAGEGGRRAGKLFDSPYLGRILSRLF
ncbi:MAG: DUF1992 domain-containing protein [Deltaproteobacteria bacterium]|jgi:hypothetical protein|nr:DUF1992 domain-containing protein [Deltaproteobacteria bacterium]